MSVFDHVTLLYGDNVYGLLLLKVNAPLPLSIQDAHSDESNTMKHYRVKTNLANSTSCWLGGQIVRAPDWSSTIHLFDMFEKTG